MNSAQIQSFTAVEESIGITQQKYENKFVYGVSSDAEAYLLRRNEVTPSQIAGVDLLSYRQVSCLMSEMIFRASESLEVPVSSSIVAICIAQFYFVRRSLLEVDMRDVCMGALFLACEMEQTHRQPYSVALVFDYVFKVFEGQHNSLRTLVYNSTEYEYMRKKVMEMQKDILFTLGFEVYKLTDIPHRYLGIFMKTLSRHGRSGEIAQVAWAMLNDCYRTTVCLYYPGQIIAAAALYLALSRLKIPMPPCPWWVLLEASHSAVQSIVAEVQALAAAKRLTLQEIAHKLNAVAKKQLNIVNEDISLTDPFTQNRLQIPVALAAHIQTQASAQKTSFTKFILQIKRKRPTLTKRFSLIEHFHFEK